MAFKIPDEMLRPLKLTHGETEMLIEEAERIISETLSVNELFIVNNRHLPKDEWKHVKSKENVQVFRARKTGQCSMIRSASEGNCSSKDGRARSNTAERTFLSSEDYGPALTSQRSATSSHSDSSAGSSGSCNSANYRTTAGLDAEINRKKPADIPLMIATGILPGIVEDVAFGALGHTEWLTRHRDAHLQHEFAAVKILATILRPTAEDPYQSLVVKWSAKSLGALSRMRDCVYIEANGITTDSNGEKVAYSLVHSIDNIARIPGFKHLDIVRVNISTCYITRQYNQASIEVFSRGFADAGGNFAESLASSTYPEMVLSVVHVVDCAYIKKLIWLGHKKRQSNRAASPSSSANKAARYCRVCATNLTKFGSLIQTGVACGVCREEICSKCAVSKKLAVEASSAKMKIKSVTCCVHCVIEAKQASTSEVAVALMERTP